MFLESNEEVPSSDIEEDKIIFRDNLNLAIQHSNRSKRSVIEKHLEDIKHWGLNLIDRQEKVNQALQSRPIVLRNRRQRKKQNDKIVNLPYFFFQFTRDHSIPNLIWNHKVCVCDKCMSIQFHTEKKYKFSFSLMNNMCRQERSFESVLKMSSDNSKATKICPVMFYLHGILKNLK